MFQVARRIVPGILGGNWIWIGGSLLFGWPLGLMPLSLALVLAVADSNSAIFDFLGSSSRSGVVALRLHALVRLGGIDVREEKARRERKDRRTEASIET